MGVSRGAPSKPSYGPCNEQHDLIPNLFQAVSFIAVLAPMVSLMESLMELKMKEGAACV